jgi:hypothetical protein
MGSALTLVPLSFVCREWTFGRPNEVTPSCAYSNASEHAYTWTAPYTGTFTFTTSKRGLTWVKTASDSCGQTRVTCDYCDPYGGDTLCTESRPLLCIRKDGS